jgi:hypothetical protein
MMFPRRANPVRTNSFDSNELVVTWGLRANTCATTTPRGRTVLSVSSHRLKLTPGHRRSTAPSSGSAEDKSSADSRTNARSPPDSPTLLQEESRSPQRSCIRAPQGPCWPLLEDKQLVLFGYDQGDPETYREIILAARPALARYPDVEVRADPSGTAHRARSSLQESTGHIIVHFDVDAVDSRDLPLANFPHYGTGVSLAAAGEALSTAKLQGSSANSVVAHCR